MRSVRQRPNFLAGATFSASTVVPTPTNVDEATTKAYVDAADAAGTTTSRLFLASNFV